MLALYLQACIRLSKGNTMVCCCCCCCCIQQLLLLLLRLEFQRVNGVSPTTAATTGMLCASCWLAGHKGSSCCRHSSLCSCNLGTSTHSGDGLERFSSGAVQ